MDVDPARLTILHYPAAVLPAPAEPLDELDELVAAVARRMVQLMEEAEGIGLAAPQVGLPWRLFVARQLDAEDAPTGVVEVFINPRLTLAGPLVAAEEGCLSLPDIRGEIRRPDQAVIEAADVEGRRRRLEGGGLQARVWQHEFDHLEGTLILDRMMPRDRLATRCAVKALEASV